MKNAAQLVASALRSIRMRASPRYHAHVTATYWSTTDDTHGDMAGEAFDFYAERIAALLGAPAQAGLVLDHNAGDGGIGMRLHKLGYRVEFSEFSPRFVTRILAAGFACQAPDRIAPASFDTIFVNNAIFYIHPSKLLAQVDWLLERVKPGGTLLLLDVPTVQRAHHLPAGVLRRVFRRLTGVFQPDAGGFFVDEARIARHFKNVEIAESWCNYRCHLIIRKR